MARSAEEGVVICTRLQAGMLVRQEKIEGRHGSVTVQSAVSGRKLQLSQFR